jgi:hypothetical protein
MRQVAIWLIVLLDEGALGVRQRNRRSERQTVMPTTIVVLILAGIISASSTVISPSARAQRSPGSRLGHSLVYDERLGGVVLLDGHWPQADHPAGDVWRWRDRRWEHLSDSGPPGTTMGAAVGDSRRGRVVTYGGRDVRGATGALWEWDVDGRRAASDTTPGRRFHHAMAHDAARGRTVMYGGAALGRWDTDTWEWDGSRWTRLTIPGPGPRAAFRMVYDEARGVVVLFGGVGPPKRDGEPQDYLSDTWLWNGTAWRRASTRGPVGRRDYSMTYDERRRVVLLHGGGAGSGPATRRFSDLWQWDGERWTEVPQRDTTPGHRYLSAMAYDAARDRTVLYGGYACDRAGRSCGVRDDTWEWDGARWEHVAADR